jgi:hypothetical protein
VAKRVDKNHREIVHAFQKMGASTFSLHELGKGVPDLCVGHQGITHLVEIKGRTGHLNAMQQDWHHRWGGRPVAVIRSIDDAHALLQEAHDRD